MERAIHGQISGFGRTSFLYAPYYKWYTTRNSLKPIIGVLMYDLNKERARKGIVQHPCKFCGVLIWRRYNKVFCSDHCKFMGSIDKTENCWNWIGDISEGGYGEIGINCKPKMAHRYSYEKFIGTIKKGLFVLHSCDNRRCVNPEHLRQGTQAENLNDASLRDRLIKGSAVKVSKLKEEDIGEIRRLYEEGLSQLKIGELYGVHQTMISTIVRRKWWKHL
jgi:hypothetical protein